jgi:hypothetical protein
LIGLVLRLAKYAEMNFKNAFATLRPNERSPQIQPMIQTPIHGSFPSGHSTEATAVARVLYELVIEGSTATAAEKRQLSEQLFRQAARIAINRTVAGVHYPIDSMAGQLLGLSVADYILARFGAGVGTGSVDAWELDASSKTQVPDGTDFTGNELLNFTTAARNPPTTYALKINLGTGAITVPVAPSPNLNWLWNEARLEWQ